MQQVTTKSFAQILATTRKVGLFLLILAFVTGAASVQAKPPSDDPSPTETEGIPEVLAVLGAIQLKLETIEADQRNIDAIIDLIYTRTGDTLKAVGNVKLDTGAIYTRTGDTLKVVGNVKLDTNAIYTRTGDILNAIDGVNSTTIRTNLEVEILKGLAIANLEESLFSMEVCFDVGLGLGNEFGLGATLAFNAEGRIGAEAFGNGVIGRVQGDAVLAGGLKSNLGAQVTGITCIDIKQLADLGLQTAIKADLVDIAGQLNINPSALRTAMLALPDAASSLLRPDLSLLNISSGYASDFDVLLGALPLPDGVTVSTIKNQTSDLLVEFELLVGSFTNLQQMCGDNSKEWARLIGIPAQIAEQSIFPICNLLDLENDLGSDLQIALDVIKNIWDKVNVTIGG